MVFWVLRFDFDMNLGEVGMVIVKVCCYCVYVLNILGVMTITNGS